MGITDNISTEGQLDAGSTLVIHYRITGDRTLGAHSPKGCVTKGTDTDSQEDTLLEFRSLLVLQMPILDPLLAVGMLPLSFDNPSVGQQVLLQWRVERIKEGTCKISHKGADEKLVAHLCLNFSQFCKSAIFLY